METYQELEREFAAFVGTKHAVAVNTGTAALHLALAARGIGPGDEVIIPDFTMIACAYAVLYCGATPVFVDCGEDLNIDVGKIAAAVRGRTRAIMPVHVYGRVCDMDEILRLARMYGLAIIEDCSEAHGATWRDSRVGAIGTVGCFSLYRNKIIHAEEGGIITTDDDVIAARMRDMKNMSFGPRHDYLHTNRIGFNYRMTNSQASLALESLRSYETNSVRRMRIREWYDEALVGMTIDRPAGSALWMYDIVCGADAQPRILETVPGSRPFFKPMSIQPFFHLPPGVENNALSASKHGVYLPVREDMTREEVRDISARVVAALAA